jgi:hypothetical protein
LHGSLDLEVIEQMRAVRVCTVLVGLVLILAACGRVPPSSSATGTPSLAAESPTVAPVPLTIPGPSFHMGEVGLVYTPVTYTATGGNAPYIWRVSDGALPRGLDISTDGAISGTPTAPGTFNFTVEVTDAGLASANLTGAIDIVPRLQVRAVNPAVLFGDNTAYVTVCLSTVGGCSQRGDQRYAPFATLSGGVLPYTYKLVSRIPSGDGYLLGLPSGTSLNGLALIGTFGLRTGSQAVYRFSVAVTDSFGATATIDVTFNILWSLGDV